MKEDEEEQWINRGGRPPYRPTDEERKVVQIAAAIGIPHEEIAKHLNGGDGITAKTLRKHFREQLDHGMFRANVRIAANLMDLAQNCQDPNVRLRASVFWAERRMGWVNTTNQRISGPEGGPIQYIERDRLDLET